MDWQRVWETASAQLTTFGLKVAGAIAVWIVGRWLIGFAVRLLSAGLERQQIDRTLQRYIGNIVGVALNIVLVVAILGYFGVETTSFAALVAAMGIAIGAAKLFGVSFALGAFFAGMVLSESELSQRAGDETLPLRDAFSVLFFVAIGMLFNPLSMVSLLLCSFVGMPVLRSKLDASHWTAATSPCSRMGGRRFIMIRWLAPIACCSMSAADVACSCMTGSVL